MKKTYFIFLVFFLIHCNNSSFKGSGTGEKKQLAPTTTTVVAAQDVQKVPITTNTATDSVVEEPVVEVPPCQKELHTTSQEVVFEATSGCAWGMNGNLSRRNTYIRARTEQVKTLQMPNNAIICNWKMTFPTQSILYDDGIVLAFNNNVLLSSYFWGTPATGDFHIYSWDRLVMSGLVGDSIYCAGQDKGLSTCSIPGMETQGTFALELNQQLVQELGEQADKEKRYEFMWITTGDDNDSDCTHSEIRFTIEISYANN